MTDAEYRKTKSRISKLADRWFDPLGLRWWSIDLRYHREGIPVSDGDAAGNWCCNAQTEVKWEYRSAALNFNMLTCADLSDEEMERVFVHECCHVLVHEMRMWGEAEMSKEKMDEAMKHEERVVCQFTDAILWTREAAALKGKRGRK